MGWDEAINREHGNREAQDDYRAKNDAIWATGASDARQVVAEFIDLMRKAGNPGLRTFKQSRAKPGRQGSLKEFLPARQVQGWQVGHGKVITPDGKIYSKFLDKDEIVNQPYEPDNAWFHSSSIDGKSYSPFTAQEIREVLAPVLIDAGAAR